MVKVESLQKKVNISLEGLKYATNRSRTVYIFINIAVLVVFISLYNQEFSWSENVNYRTRPYRAYAEEVGIDASPKSDDELRRQYANMYFERQSFTVPLLGIKCSGSDLTLYAPIGMVILITWYFFSLRRENSILRDVKSDFDKTLKIINKKENTKNNNENGAIDEYKILLQNIYRGCLYSFVTTTVTKNDYIKKNESFGHNYIARPVIALLDWLPVLILLFNLFIDLRDIIFKPIMKQHIILFLWQDIFLLVCCCIVSYQIVINRKIMKKTQSILYHMSKASKEYDYSID